MRWKALPGAELVVEGLRDLEADRTTKAALLVSIGAPKLRSLGVPVGNAIDDAEHRLWMSLAESGTDSAHGRYNALVRRLVSFERALACAG